MKTFELSNKQSNTNGRKQTIESIRKKSYWEPEWVNKITKGVIEDSNRANSLRDALKIKETDNTLSRWDNELTQLNEMTRERKEKEHIRNFVTNSFPRAQLDEVQKRHLSNSLSTEKPRISSPGTGKTSTMLYTGGKVTPTNAFKKGNDTPEYEQMSYSGGFGNQVAGSIGKSPVELVINGNTSEFTTPEEKITQAVEKLEAEKTEKNQNAFVGPRQYDYITLPEDDFSKTYGTTINKHDGNFSRLGDDSQESRKNASDIIKANKDTIIKTAKEFGVNPVILACCVFTEQACNVDKIEPLIDTGLGMLGIDTSIGIAQVKISTAKLMEQKGYVKPIEFAGMNMLTGELQWKIPGVPGFISGTEQEVMAIRLSDKKDSIMYAAAYLKYIQDSWKGEYSRIDGDTAIAATLYNKGFKEDDPHGDPGPNDFGRYARANYYYVESLLGL